MRLFLAILKILVFVFISPVLVFGFAYGIIYRTFMIGYFSAYDFLVLEYRADGNYSNDN